MVLRLLSIIALGTAMLSFGRTVAIADDGPPRLLSAAGGVQPPQTIERIANLGNGKAVLALNGYGSGPAERVYWDPLFADLPGYQHFIFGLDLCAYGTYAPIAENAVELRRCVRRLARDEDYAEIALVGVSMGGNVMHAANALGLGRNDGVAAQVTFSSPLNGSSTARSVQRGAAVATALHARAEAEAIVLAVGNTHTDTQAMRDLAARSAPFMPAGVRVQQFCAALDEVVSLADCRVRGHTILTSTAPRPGAAAHGGQMTQPAVRAQAVAVIRGEPVVRDRVAEATAGALASMADDVRPLILGVAITTVVAAAVVTHAIRPRLLD